MSKAVALESEDGKAFELSLQGVYENLGLVCLQLKALETGLVYELELNLVRVK